MKVSPDYVLVITCYRVGWASAGIWGKVDLLRFLLEISFFIKSKKIWLFLCYRVVWASAGIWGKVDLLRFLLEKSFLIKSKKIRLFSS